jgi:cell division protein ZapB
MREGKLEHQAILQQFEAIETKVQQLIEVCNSLESNNLELKNTIERLEEALREKVEAEQIYSEERAQVRTRVEGLLGKLADIAQG